MTAEVVSVSAMTQESLASACALWRDHLPGFDANYDTLDMLSRYLTRNPGFSSVAQHGDTLVGAMLCGHDGRRGSFYHLAVCPSWRRQGIARRLVERSSCLLDAAGITSAFCFTRTDDPAAQAAWRSLGLGQIAPVEYRSCQTRNNAKREKRRTE